ncbi:MAG: hypothetical protein O3B95_11660 [Chloroflexi bacterium]|nr:hypothetical protein [Chloroflexota bacterium]
MALFRIFGIGSRVGLMLGLLALTSIAVAAAACTDSGVAQQDYDALTTELNSAKANLSSAQSEITTLKADLADQSTDSGNTVSEHHIIQVGQSQPAPAAAVL